MRKKTTRPRPGRRSAADVVADMAASGLVEDEIAQRLGVHKNVLRARYIDSIKAGKATAAASEAGAVVLTVAEYHVLNAMKTSFAGAWFNPTKGNDLWAGPDGKGARTIEDAFAGWKSRGGKFNTVGLSTRLDSVKAEEFGRIVQDYHNRQNRI